jgi:hypothetical protein
MRKYQFRARQTHTQASFSSRILEPTPGCAQGCGMVSGCSGAATLILSFIAPDIVLQHTTSILVYFLASNFTRVSSKYYKYEGSPYENSSPHKPSFFDSSPTSVQIFASLALLCNITGLGGPYMFLRSVRTIGQTGGRMWSNDEGYLALMRRAHLKPLYFSVRQS